MRDHGQDLGGGLRDSKVIALSLYNASIDKESNGLEEIADVDLDRFDKRIIVAIAPKNNPSLVKSVGDFGAPFKDGYESTFPSTSNDVLRIKKQDDGLYTLSIQYGYGDSATPSGYRMVLVVGEGNQSTTKTTEVSTMSITSDQPISAGNLKAALDGLTGGGRS